MTRKHFELDIKADLILTRTLHKKSNAFNLISLAKDLGYHMNILNRIGVSAELSDKLQNYEQILKQNKVFVVDLCEQKAQSLKETLLKILSNFIGNLNDRVKGIIIDKKERKN